MWKLTILLTILANSVLALTILANSPLPDRRVTCYYRNWAQYGKGKAKFLPEDIDANLCSVVKYAFMRINHETYKLETTKPNDEEMLGRIVALKKVSPALKVVVTVGGWSHDRDIERFSQMVQTAEKRATFIQSVVDFLKRNKLDGLCFSWLYPGTRPKLTPTDRERFTLLLKETSDSFKRDATQRNTERFLLSATVTSSVRRIPESYEIPTIAQYVDSIDVIVHSLWGFRKQQTGSATAMKGNQPTVIDSIEEWLSRGMPSEKINIGFPLYGQTFALESASSYELGARTSGPGEEGTYTRRKGILAYYEICSRSWTHKTEWFKSKTEAPFASEGKLWVGYDDPASFKYKVVYLLQKYKLNGVTAWAMDLDDFTGSFCNAGKYPLITQIKSAMEEAAAPAPSITCQVAVDIGFLLDSSGSIRNHYSTEKDFLKLITASFGISKDGTRAGVITFSYYVENSIKLNDHFNMLSFNAAVDAIPLMGYTTRIDSALRLAQNVMFTKENGARDGFPKLLVLLTDGTQTQTRNSEHPGDIATELRASGVHILVVGIGPGIDEHELEHMAGDPKSFFIAPTFGQLLQSNMLSEVRARSCPSGTSSE